MLAPPTVDSYEAAVLRYQLPAPAGVNPALGEYALLKRCATRNRG